MTWLLLAQSRFSVRSPKADELSSKVIPHLLLPGKKQWLLTEPPPPAGYAKKTKSRFERHAQHETRLQAKPIIEKHPHELRLPCGAMN